ICFSFFFQPCPPPHLHTLSLHDALPISGDARVTPARSTAGLGAGPALFPRPITGASPRHVAPRAAARGRWRGSAARVRPQREQRSEEHTSELQSQSNLVCRLLREKKTK